MLKRLLRKANSLASAPRAPDDVRVYAIGDIHGCDAEFARLLDLIEADHRGRPPKHQVIVLLGDLVDRGPDSAGVVERAMALAASERDVRLLRGNHEELLLAVCAGDPKALRIFARHGGRETALSYGITSEAYDAADFDQLADLIEAAVPADQRAFLARMEDVVVVGDYAFVHAGIRPGVPLAEQGGHDLRWIRERFLNHAAPHEKFIVHGHTITETVDEHANRLGIDTGAYATGRLTAVALEGEDRWFLTT